MRCDSVKKSVWDDWSEMTDLSVNTFIVLLILCMYNTVQSTSDTQTISLEIGRSLQDAMKTWFDNDQITKAYNLQTYQTYTGGFVVSFQVLIYIPDIHRWVCCVISGINLPIRPTQVGLFCHYRYLR